VLLGCSKRCRRYEHPIERLGVGTQERTKVRDRGPKPTGVDVLLRSERCTPEELADALERRAFARKLERNATAINRAIVADRADAGLEDRLPPTQRARCDGTMTRARLAPRAEALDVGTIVDTAARRPPRRWRGRTPNEATTRVGVERLALHA
jgi:hypothetical protein